MMGLFNGESLTPNQGLFQVFFAYENFIIPFNYACSMIRAAAWSALPVVQACPSSQV